MEEKTLTAAQKKYLAAIYKLDSKGNGIRSISIGKTLNVSRASVSIMMDRLVEDGYVTKEKYGSVYLTPEGRKLGRKYARNTAR